MRSSLPAIALLTSLAACSGGDTNPVTNGPAAGEETGTDSGSPADDSAVTTGTTTTRLQGDVTGITLNADNPLTSDDLPFDGPEGTGEAEGGTRRQGREGRRGQALRS